MALNLASTLREHRWIVLISLLFVLLGGLRLNDISLYTDSTRYVIWGTSFAHAKGLVDDTQPDPEWYVVNAPFFSVLLSPVLLFFPYSLLAAKVWTLLWGVAFIIAFYHLLLRFFGKTPAIIGALLVACNPLVLLFSTEVLSESAFLTLVAVCFIALERLESENGSHRRDMIILFGIASLIVLLREVAIALVGSLVLYLLLRKQYKIAIILFAGFAVCFGAWLYRNLVLVGVPPTSQATNINFIFEHFLTPAQAPILQEFGLRLTNNTTAYAAHLGGLLFYPLPEIMIVEPTGLFLAYFRGIIAIKYLIPVLLVPLLFLGMWRDLVDRRTGFARVLFVVCYLFVIFIYPVHDVRFLLPVFPIMIFYVCAAARWLRDRWFSDRPVVLTRIAAVYAVLLIVPNLICVFELDRSNVHYIMDPLGFYQHLSETHHLKNMFTKPLGVLGKAVREQTPEGTIVAAASKEFSIFIGNRKLLELNNGVPIKTFDYSLRMNAADYLLSTNVWDGFLSYEFQMSESKRFWFELMTQVAGMRLYKIHPTYVTPKEVWLETKRIPIDTISANGLLRKGRVELLRGQFQKAISSFRQASELNPGQPMVPYQLTLAYAMNDQLSEASLELQRLYGFDASTTYTAIATRHLAIATALHQANQYDDPAQRSMASTEAAMFYWSFDFPNAAYSTLRTVLNQDSTYFSALLWGWQYAMQRGDTAQAKVYLRRLRTIDRSNPVVQQFSLIEQAEDSLRRTSDSVRRGNLHLGIARSYKSVDLPDEAIDEAQRALRENPRCTEAWLYQAQLFEEQKAPRAARAAFQRALEIDPTNTMAKSRLSTMKNE